MNNSMTAAASPVTAPHATVGRWSVVTMLAWREWTRFFRQRHRVIGALGQPILFWLLFGTGMHGAFRVSGSPNFMIYYLPGTIALIVLFTAIFATISIIEDRREGFLQNVLVAPVPRWTIAIGKIIGGGAIAWVQAVIFLCLAVATGSVAASTSLLPLLGLLALTAMGLTAIGVVFAWPMDSTQGFHAIMNIVLMPLWLLSGAFFPIPIPDTNAGIGQLVLHWVMRANPLSYAIAGMRQLMNPTAEVAIGVWQPDLGVCWLVTSIGTVLACGIAILVVQRSTRGELG